MKQFFADYRERAALERVHVTQDHTRPDEVRGQLEMFGFAVLNMPHELAPMSAMTRLAQEWSLGDPYIPRLYRLPGARQFGKPLTDITTRAEAQHPGFTVRSGQRLHVDGVLDHPEDVQTVMLYCVKAAARGGRTIVFNSVAAFHELREWDPEAAAVLTNAAVLRRFSTLRGVTAHTDGPAFTVLRDGNVVNRFSDGTTELWQAEPKDCAALSRALEFFRGAAEQDGRYRCSVLVEPFECLILRNDRVSHGREPFEDDPAAPRHLIRAMFQGSL